jgi:hypothetical protein
MRKRVLQNVVGNTQKSTSNSSAFYPALIAGICGLIGAFGGAYWQSTSGSKQKIYDSRVNAYSKVISSINDEQIKSLRSMRDLIAATKRVSSDGDAWSIDTDWNEFISSSEGKEAIEKLVSAIAPAKLHGSDRTVLISRAIGATLNDNLPTNTIRLLSSEITEQYLRDADPRTPCYGCNDSVDRDVTARLFALSSLLTMLENSMVCDLNSESKLCS